MSHAVGLRIDHVMGLFRQFWIPSGAPATHGAYLQFPSDELLAILAVESYRAQCWIAGEDLGTVPVGMRERLADLNILSHRVVLFEPEHPRDYPPKTLAIVTTHDLPTLAGLWTGKDLAAARQTSTNVNEQDFVCMRRCIKNVAGVDDSASLEQLVEAVYAGLSLAPSAVLLANLEDILQVAERPNMPGTTTQWPNWRIALPTKLEDLANVPLFQRITEHLSRHRCLPR
jgi:4-alpha-glucanotransferase